MVHAFAKPAKVRHHQSSTSSLLAAISGSVAIGASSAHERNSLPSTHGLHDETCAAATLAGIANRFVPDNIMHGLQEFKPMTKDIAASHHRTGGCHGDRQFDLQFDDLSYLQFDR